MSICYNDDVKSDQRVNMQTINATKCYVTHYSNLLYLTFISNNSKDNAEKRQALKELTICERKLKFWKFHHNYNQVDALREVTKLKDQWRK